jgi:hypothetical protein
VNDNDSNEPLLADLPPPLAAFVRSLYPNDILARRALLAPWPDFDFHSVWDERQLWNSEVTSDRKQAFERMLTVHREDWFASVEQPFFPAPGTLGTLCSPYPQLSDADYWLYVALWGSETGARTWLEKPLFGLSGQTTLEFLEKAQHQGLFSQVMSHLMKKQEPRLQAWNAHIQVLASNYL